MGANGPGVTDTTITIGVTYYQSAASANAAFGASGVNLGDPVLGTKILVKAINDSGGVAGRRLQALFYAVDPQASTPYAIEGQAVCTYFTQDHHVFAMIDGAPAADARKCLQKHGVAYLGGSLIKPSLWGNEVDAYATELPRMFATLVPGLASLGWFSPWNSVTASAGTLRAKVGIVTSDSPDDNHAVDGVLVPALRAVGYAPNPGDIIRITPPQGFGDDGAVAAAIDAAVLKLNSDGVDHVILNDGNGSLSLLFNTYAYSQNYFPRYGGSSGNAWQVFLSAGDLQPKTLNGALGIGWQPLFDVPYGKGDGPEPNAARHRCFAIFRAGGTPHTDAASAGGQAEGCDVAFLLPTLFTGYKGPLNLDVFLARVNALGTSYQLSSAFGSRFSSTQHAGIGEYKAMAFTASCKCIRYTGSMRPMSS